jgi:hypothetical protein
MTVIHAAWAALPPLGKAIAAPVGTGLALEVSRQILPIPDRWAVNKIMRFYGNLPWMTESFAQKIVDVADRLDVDPFALTNLMYFESGLNPQAVNPRSGATGLIQFMPRTASGLGTSTTSLRSMSAEQQMDWVEAYLAGVQRSRGKLKKPRDLMLAVFYPAFIGKASWRLFPRNVRRANPGIVTPWDYEQLVRKRSRMPMRAILL